MVTEIHRAESAIKTGDTKTGFDILREVLASDPDSERAWWIMSGLVQREQRVNCLKQVLRINPENQFARDTLDEMLSSPPQPETKPPREIPPASLVEKPFTTSPDLVQEENGLKTWVHARRSNYFFTILGPDHLTMAMTNTTAYASVRAKLKKGIIPDQLLSKMQTISLSSISTIKLVRSGFLVYYQDGATEHSLRLNLADQAAAKKVLVILQKRLGPDFALRTQPTKTNLVLGISGVLTLGAAILTSYLYWVTQEVTSGRAASRGTFSSQLMINLVERLGAVGVILIGAFSLIAALGASAWMLFRPITTTSLTRR